MTRDQNSAQPSILAVEKICKSFGEVQVLFGIDFDVRAGEVHALLGENGAGKSTLLKILSGLHKPSSGRILIEGKNTILPENGAAENLGIVMIHQEFNLAEQLSVTENIFLGRELRKGMFLDTRRMYQETQDILEKLCCQIDPRARVETLSVSDKQMVEIAKAMSRNVKILIMDEPTAVLTSEEVKILFRQVTYLKKLGAGIVFISHKLDEVKEIADRVTVLRDGQWIATKETAVLTQDAMARLMVGRELSDMFPPKNEPDVDAEIVLSAENISVEGQVTSASFDLRKGEILGFAGMIGAGRSAIFEALLGLRPLTSGKLYLNNQIKAYQQLADAVPDKIVYLTKDRKGKGLVLEMSLRHNLTLLALEKFTRHGLIREQDEEMAVQRAVRRFDIRAKDLNAKVGVLSGGNQQKLLLGKVMEVDPDIIVIDEPTRGIDVGTKQQIYHIIAALAAEQKSVVVISSEMPEIIGLSHRVCVMRQGFLTGILSGDEIEEHEIMRYATGLKGIKNNDATFA